MLATHREYIPLLREEIETTEQESKDSEVPIRKLRLMDSFLRETSRLNPIDGCEFDDLYMQECDCVSRRVLAGPTTRGKAWGKSD